MSFALSVASASGGARVFTVNGGTGKPIDYLAKSTSKKAKKSKRSALKADTDGLRLVQDSDFPEASTRIKSSRDGNYLIATGVYKPRMKVLDLPSLGIKFERIIDCETIDFEILSDTGWEKTIHVQSDRQIEVHNQKGPYFRTRTPRPGRCIAYHFPTCDALIGGEGRELYRLNLEQGRFLAPFELSSDVRGVNALDISPAHGLLSVGTDRTSGGGTVEMWDARMRTRAATLSIPFARLSSFASSSTSNVLPGIDDSQAPSSVSVTALASRNDGLNIAVGTSSGHTLLYDMRSPRPYLMKDQGYGEPIKRLQWVNVDEEPHVASVDSHVLKIWSSRPDSSVANFVSVSPPSKINDLHILPGSGLIWLANEQPALTSYYVPELGSAPSWARFLDNMTDDADLPSGEVQNVYEDYKFVDRTELSSLNLDHLVGTPSLRPYMHGFFVDLRLYSKAKAIANPFAYAEHREKLIADKLERERESRIRSSAAAGASKKIADEAAAVPKVKVNQALLDRIVAREAKEARRRQHKHHLDALDTAAKEAEEDEDAEATARKAATAQSLLQDDRFGALFEDPDFEVDTTSREFALLNPSEAHRLANDAIERKIDGIASDEEELDEFDDAEDAGAASDSSDENELIKYVPPTRQSRHRDVAPIRSVRDAAAAASSASRSAPAASVDRPQLVVERPAIFTPISVGPSTLGDKLSNGATSHKKRRTSAVDASDGDDQRQDGDGEQVMRALPGGGMELSFQPRTKSGKSRDERRAKLASSKDRQTLVGAGMQRAEDAADERRRADENALAREGDEAASGRKRRRQVHRSASKTTMRRRQQR